MPIFSSRDATRIRRFLSARGVGFHPRDAVALELVCLVFWPNHIEGVIEQVLGGKNPEAKAEKANKQGWAYFHAPVCQMLGSATRAGARRSDAIELEVPFSDSSRVEAIYREVATSLLEHDMTHDEARLLFVEVITTIQPSLEQLRMAIGVAIQNDARSVHYLHGVLLRDSQTRDTRVRERTKERTAVDPWTPDPQRRTPSTRDVEQAAERWDRLVSDVNLVRGT